MKPDTHRKPKPDEGRFSGKARHNKIKDANLMLAGSHERWARDFARDFIAALPSYPEGSMKSWVVGVKICPLPGPETNPPMLRLKVSNGGRGDLDKRRWVYVALGSPRPAAEVAAETVAAMEAQPAKRDGGWTVAVA